MVTYPRKWEEVQLGKVADVTKLAGFEFTEHVIYADFGNIIAIRGLNVKQGQLILNDVKYIDGSNFAKLGRSKLYKNDLLFTYVGTVGEVALIPDDDKYYLAPNVARVRLGEKCCPEYVVYYMLHYKFYKDVIFPLIATSSQPALSMQNVRKFMVHLPPLAEQCAIAATLSSFDKHIDNLTALIEKKKAIRDGALSDLMSGRTRLAGFSGEWEDVKVCDIADRFDNLRIPVPAEKRIKGNIPYYGANGIQDYVKGFTHDGEYILIAEDGANNLKKYPVQYVSGQIWVNNHAHVLQGKENVVDTKFLGFAITCVDFEAVLVGGTRIKLNAKTLMKMDIKIPPSLAEQKAIADILTSMDTEIQNLEAEQDKMQAIREGAMEDLLTGRVRLPM